MRILIISDAWKPQINGVVRTYELMIPILERMGHTVHVIGPADFPRRYPMPGYREIELVPFPRRMLAEKIDAIKPDTIHVATEGPLGWAAQAICKKRGWPYTTAYHTQFPDYVALRAAKFVPPLFGPVRNACIRLIRIFHRAAHAIMTTTGSIEDQLQEWGVNPSFRRLTRGTDKNIFHPPANGEKPAIPGHADLQRPIALYVGRVAIEKNIRDFLDMEWDGSKVVVGDGPSMTGLKRDYPHIVFTGKKTGTDLAGHYRAGDVFVFPSRTDTFGIVLIEALACGLPIAAYNVPGPKDIVTMPELGALDDNLARAARRAMQNGTAAARFSHVQNHYTWDEAARQFANAVAETLITRDARTSIPHAAPQRP